VLVSTFWQQWLPFFNTCLILVSGVFLLLGYYFIRQRRIQWHRRCMLTAAVFAALFLVVYVVRYLLLPTKVFAGEGPVRAVYLAILASHTILAMAVGPLVLVTLRRALRRDYRRHRRIARVTLPVWLYVVVTGWVVYAMLHAF
jgi:putative membrane protein